MSRQIKIRKPTRAEMFSEALKLQNDVDFCNLRDEAVRQGWGTFEADFYSICETLGETPPRIHNIGEANKWGYTTTPDDYGNKIGPECCWSQNLGALPPDLTPEQIAQVNGRVKDSSGTCKPTVEDIVL